MDWSNLERIPTRTLELELEHFWISGSPWKASVLKAEIDRRKQIEQTTSREQADA